VFRTKIQGSSTWVTPLGMEQLTRTNSVRSLDEIIPEDAGTNCTSEAIMSAFASVDAIMWIGRQPPRPEPGSERTPGGMRGTPAPLEGLNIHQGHWTRILRERHWARAAHKLRAKRDPDVRDSRPTMDGPNLWSGGSSTPGIIAHASCGTTRERKTGQYIRSAITPGMDHPKR
jgi:hypothetical protein